MFLFNLRKFHKQAPAFTLLETVTVLFIISVGMVGVLSLTVRSANFQTTNKNLVIAGQLAQEGIELVYNVRDTNWRLNTATTTIPWNRYITGTATGTNYKLDYLNFAPIPITDISQARLQQGSSTNPGLYLHDATQPDSIFSRMITIASSTSASSSVTSLVTWDEQGQTKSYQLQTVLYNWK
jgi:type II secretory pathway pseudopilin PulG